MKTNNYLQEISHYDGHDDAVDGDSLAENNANKVLSFDTWSFHSSPKDTRSGGHNTPKIS